MATLYEARSVGGILESFAQALRPVWILGAVLASLSLLGTLATEWISVKHQDRHGRGGHEDAIDHEEGGIGVEKMSPNDAGRSMV